MNVSTVQSMINAIEKPAIFITPDYVIQAVNRKYIDTYQVQVQTGTHRCFEISHQASESCDHHGEDCPLQRCQQTNQATSVIHIHETGTGHAYCDILMRPVVDEDGMTIGFLEILENVSYAANHSEKDKLIGMSAPFQQMLKLINRSGKSDISVLLQGETGTGKELAAHAIHQVSKRAEKPFLIVECTGLNEALFESELFGHEKGAFTGASQNKKGLVELAHGGTLFLDEVGDVPLNLQVKLLRLLETGKYRSVGALEEKSADFRLICASHKNLEDMVESGEFRNDLYYRIAAFPILLPALRERSDDISLLAQHILNHSEFSDKSFDKDSLITLMNYDFPGNIRELKNIVQRAALIADNQVIQPSDLSIQWNETKEQGSSNSLLNLEQVEKSYLKNKLKQFDFQVELLADKLDMNVRTLYRKLAKHNISLERDHN